MFKMFKNINKIRLLPGVTVAWLFLTFVVSYTIATSLGHVYPVWPYISDTGANAPESCYFGLMLNIGSFLMVLVFYCQYIQVKLKIPPESKAYISWLNIFCLLLGFIAAFGACIVANFQETSDIAMHLFGANMIFGVGAGYFVFQTILLSLLNSEDKIGYKLNILRAVLCVVHIVTFSTTIVYAKKSFANLKGEVAWNFNPDMENYEFRLASTFSEWALAVCLGLYVLSFTYDFKHLKVNVEFSDSRKKKTNENNERLAYQIA